MKPCHASSRLFDPLGFGGFSISEFSVTLASLDGQLKSLTPFSLSYVSDPLRLSKP